LSLAVVVALRLSPWPAALIIRHRFTTEGRRLSDALRPYLPRGIQVIPDQAYGPEPAARLDVYYPATPGPRPTILWVHGGGWVAGSKNELANYFRILAAEGFTVVGIDYSLAPGHTYPTPVRQVNQALAYLRANADRLQVDTLRLYLAGDSGGAQIAAQLALLLRDSSYAAGVGIRPELGGASLEGAILFCGPYDIRAVRLDGPFGGFLRTVLWAYSGTRRFATDTTFARVSIVHDVSASFPPTFLSVGNADPLAPQSRALAAALARVGVPLDTLFYPPDHPTALPHEYQFNLDNPEGREALARLVAFVRRRS